MAQSARRFRVLLVAELKKTPWWLASLVFHGALLHLLFQVPFATFVGTPEATIVVRTQEAVLEPLAATPLTETPLPKSFEVFEVVPGDEPVIKDAKVADHNETDNDMEFGETLGVGDFISDAPFHGHSTNAAVGIGGGAGGAFGGRGGHRNLRAMAGGRASGHLLVIEKGEDDGKPPMFRGRPVTQGMLVAEDEAGKEIGLFPLRHTDVKARISGLLASVDVTQQYRNRFETKVEAVYVFPLPRRAAVSDFLMTVGDRTIRGMIRERGEARRIYEEAKKKGQTASLLTQERPNIFTQRVANLEPGRGVDVTITYFHPLRVDEDGAEFVFPMVVGPRYMPGGTNAQKGEPHATRVNPPVLPAKWRPGHDISVEVSVDAGVEIESLECLTHQVSVTQTSPSEATVELETGTVVPNKDFVLRLETSGDAHRFGLVAHRARNGGFFAMLLAPKAETEPGDVMPREMVFLLDCSGSMSGEPIGKAKAVVRRFLRGMSERDTFRVIRFSDSASGLGPLPVTPANVEAGLAYVDKLHGSGGTRMITGIRAA
ncbi:MAG: VIT domain-containing protein, partial [Planctomycetota bacterium]